MSRGALPPSPAACIAAALAAVLALWPRPAPADQIHLDDGRVLDGDVIQEDDERIELRTRDGKVLRIDQGEVVVHLDDDKRVVPRGGRSVAPEAAPAPGASTGAAGGPSSGGSAPAVPSSGASSGGAAAPSSAGVGPRHAPISAPDARVKAEAALASGKADALAGMSPADAVAAVAEAVAAAAERASVSPTARAAVRSGARIAIAYAAHEVVLGLVRHPQGTARAAAVAAIAAAAHEAVREAEVEAGAAAATGDPLDADALAEDLLRALREPYADALSRVLTDDPDEDARAAALDALSLIEPLRILPAIATGAPAARRRAVDVLVALPSGAVADEEAVIRLLATGRAGVTTAVLEVLARHPIPALRERILRLLSRDEPLEVRLGAVRALAALGAAQVPALGDLLWDAAPEVRVAAAERLASLGDPAAVPWLVAALDGAEHPLARTITGGLLRITGERRLGASYARWATWAREHGIVLPERRPRRERPDAPEPTPP